MHMPPKLQPMRAHGCPVHSQWPHGISLQLCYITANSPQEALPVRQQPALLSLICFCGTSSAPWAPEKLRAAIPSFKKEARGSHSIPIWWIDLSCVPPAAFRICAEFQFALTWDSTPLIFLHFAGFLPNLLLWNSDRKKAQREGFTRCRAYKSTDQKELKIWPRWGGAPAETQYDALQEG